VIYFLGVMVVKDQLSSSTRNQDISGAVPQQLDGVTGGLDRKAFDGVKAFFWKGETIQLELLVRLGQY